MQNITSTEAEANLDSIQGESGSLFVPSICKLMDDPESYNGKEVRVRTTFVRVGSEQWFGDESCVSRHPLFDAEFHSSFEDLICRDKTHFSNNLCKIVTPSETAIDIAVTGVFSGRFDFYPADRGFTKNGHRFRLKVDDVAAISDIQNVKKEVAK